MAPEEGVRGVEPQSQPDGAEGHPRGDVEDLSVDEHPQGEREGGGDVLQKAHGDQGNAGGAKGEEQEGHRGDDPGTGQQGVPEEGPVPKSGCPRRARNPR